MRAAPRRTVRSQAPKASPPKFSRDEYGLPVADPTSMTPEENSRTHVWCPQCYAAKAICALSKKGHVVIRCQQCTTMTFGGNADADNVLRAQLKMLAAHPEVRQQLVALVARYLEVSTASVATVG